MATAASTAITIPAIWPEQKEAIIQSCRSVTVTENTRVTTEQYSIRSQACVQNGSSLLVQCL